MLKSNTEKTQWNLDSLGWNEGLVHKIIAAQPWRSEFDSPQNPHKVELVAFVYNSYAPVVKRDVETGNFQKLND